MPEAKANGVRLYYELSGEGEPLVLVHGSWTDATSWRLVFDDLAASFRVLAYDRRGHSRSERPDSQGSVEEDGDDLAALLDVLEMAPAHVVTNSFGGSIALRLATRRPELFRSLSCHEPPLWALLAKDPESKAMLEQGAHSVESVARRIAAGDHEGAARQFAEEVAFGPGAWEDELPAEAREIMIQNAPTFLDEVQDPSQLAIDEQALTELRVPIRLTDGSLSLPVFPRVVVRLTELISGVTQETIEGAAHLPHVQAPQRYVEVTTRGLGQLSA